MQRVLLIAFITFIAGCAAVGIYIFAASPRGGSSEEILGTLLLIGLASVCLLGSAAMWVRRKCHPLGPVGSVAAPLALLLSMIPLWGRIWLPGRWYQSPRPWWYSQEIFNCMALAWIAASISPYIGLLYMARLHFRFAWVRWATIAAALTVGLAIIGAMNDQHFFGRRPEVAIFCLIIVAGFGTLAIPALHWYSSIKTNHFVDAAPLGLQVTCPRCAKPQTLPVGRSSCSFCGLRFSIEIEENVCEKCGYSLYRLESTTCPECGTPILQNPALSPSIS